jgi:hypothetical protein
MSLLDYQRALCDLIASPAMCVALRADPADVLEPYSLTERERRRLESAAGQPGMSTSCTLHRVNRITPIHSSLPLTCAILGERLIGEAERFWSQGKPSDLQFGPETERFAQFLLDRQADGALDEPFLGEVLRLELAMNDLRLATRLDNGDPLVRLVQMDHDPLPVLAALADGSAPSLQDAAQGEFYLAIDARGGRIELSVVEPALARTTMSSHR